jgi:hypothetical protein
MLMEFKKHLLQQSNLSIIQNTDTFVISNVHTNFMWNEEAYGY